MQVLLWKETIKVAPWHSLLLGGRPNLLCSQMNMFFISKPQLCRSKAQSWTQCWWLVQHVPPAAAGEGPTPANLHPINTSQARLTSKHQSKTYNQPIPSSSSHTSPIPEATSEAAIIYIEKAHFGDNKRKIPFSFSCLYKSQVTLQLYFSN